jgi:hypothetical protein
MSTLKDIRRKNEDETYIEKLFMVREFRYTSGRLFQVIVLLSGLNDYRVNTYYSYNNKVTSDNWFTNSTLFSNLSSALKYISYSFTEDYPEFVLEKD